MLSGASAMNGCHIVTIFWSHALEILGMHPCQALNGLQINEASRHSEGLSR